MKIFSKRYISFSLFVLFNIFFSSSYGQQELILDKIVAKVGSELILLSEIEEQFSYIQDQQGESENLDRCQIMANLMAQNLLVSRAKLDSLVVSPQEVESQSDARIERILQYMNGDVELFQEYYGESVNQVRARFTQDLKNQILADRMRGQILGEINVTPSEVRSFYNEIPYDSLPYFNSEVEIGEIVYYPLVSDEEDKKAREQAENLRTRIVDGGEEFGGLAKIYSDDKGSAAKNGELGWVKRGTFVTEFEAVVFSLEIDEISTPVETEFGYHIIQLQERRGNNIKARHILITPTKSEADFVLAKSFLRNVKKSVSLDSLPFEIAVRRFSDKDQQSFNNGGRMINPQAGNTFFEVNELDPDIYFAVDTMQIGEISEPVKFTDERGAVFFRLIKLISRTDPHKADLQQDYSKIRAAAAESKKGQYFENWMLDKAKSTYSEVDKTYLNCPGLEEVWHGSDSDTAELHPKG